MVDYYSLTKIPKQEPDGTSIQQFIYVPVGTEVGEEWQRLGQAVRFDPKEKELPFDALKVRKALTEEGIHRFTMTYRVSFDKVRDDWDWELISRNDV